jgi:serine/threonine protein kinase
MSRLNSDYLVKYFETFTFKNSLCVVMEYYENGNLHEFIKLHREKGKKIENSVCFVV